MCVCACVREGGGRGEGGEAVRRKTGAAGKGSGEREHVRACECAHVYLTRDGGEIWHIWVVDCVCGSGEDRSHMHESFRIEA